MPSVKKVVFRSSVDGQFVPEKFAVKHPRETQREVIKPAPAPAPRKKP